MHCIHELVAAQAQQTPDAVAVRAANHQLTYAELDTRANQLAHHLIDLGVGPERLVGICMERGLDLVIGVLGVLKTGAAYVPLDPSYPSDRLAYMLRDSGASVVLTQTGIDAVEADQARTVVRIDGEWPSIAARPGCAPATTVGPHNLAYVIYTSGSTGQPKGVAIQHASTVAFLRWSVDFFGVEDLRSVLAATSICFDLSVFEMFAPLLCGGTVVVARNALELPSIARLTPITLVNTVPSAMWELVRVARLPESVRVVNLAGEPLPNELAQIVYQSPSVARVVNLYGPTEDTTYSTVAVVKKGSTESPSIGVAIHDSHIYLLDERLRAVHDGEVGDVYIGGAGLARGYLNRPDLTAEKFVPNPFGAPGSRMYRTGDLARVRTDGNLEYLGRSDQQVKIRGFRIELGEIESALRQQPGVEQALVVLHTYAEHDRRLVAYVVPESGQSLQPSMLRHALSAQLPHFMVPSAFVLLERFPVTPNGKIDRAALPSPQATAEREVALPRTPIQCQLAAIWQEVLRVAPIGIDDNFFELGGHSLLAMQISSRCGQMFGIDVPVQTLFDAPTVALLAARLGDAERSTTDQRGIPSLSRDQDLPMSFAQQRLWLQDRLDPGNPAYNVPAVLDLHGPLDVAALRAGMAAILRRHEALRTSFATREAGPVQVIAAPFELPLPIVDLSALPAAERPAAAERIAQEQAREPFDLSKGPLVRALLVRLSDHHHQLLLVQHHIVTDGWSLGVLFRELTTLYAGGALPELPVQYADFAAWQRQSLDPDRLEEQLSFWRSYLDGAPTNLDLLPDFPRSARQSLRGDRSRLHLAPRTIEAVQGLARREGATPFMVLLAAFEALLGKYTGQQEFLVGTPMANRGHRAIEELCGFFVNTLPLRCDLRGQPTFRELLARVRQGCLAASAHQELPFERLVDALEPDRDLSRPPVFQVTFAVDDADLKARDASGLDFQLSEYANGTAKFDLSVTVSPEPEGLRITADFNADLFEAGTIEALLRQFGVLLEAALDDPERSVASLALLTSDEERALLEGWRAAGGTDPPGRLVHDLVAWQAQQTPDAIAVRAANHQLTYAELDTRANQLAHHLIELGVGPERLVGICMERGLDLAIGVLGVLKTGAAYVPLDPSYPSDRLAYMLADSAAPVLLTQAAIAAHLEATECMVLRLDTDWPSISQRPTTAPATMVAPDNLAYVIYTSGSTGQPKGVELTHAGLLNLVGWHQRAFRVSAADRATQIAGVGFDASVWEIWPYLSAGACICIPSPATRASARALRDWMLAERVSISFVPTPLAEEMLNLEWPTRTSLRYLLTGGDQLRRYPSAAFDFTLVNNYGPTENTVVTTSGHVPNEGDARRPPTLGRAIDNVAVYVLDERGMPLPLGVPGELWIGGLSVARGYHRQPALTAERFMPDPFSGQPGVRMYRTGDRARVLAGGEIEFLGRLDQQVKLRGFRIEPGEIEVALCRHPDVREAVVQAHGATTTDRFLVAYLVPSVAGGLTSGTYVEVRDFLADRLPPYMVPTAFITLDALPLTPNGKVDRRKLPVPTERDRIGAHDYVAPRTPTERSVAHIWSQVLGMNAVGIHENFFALGGNSLSAARVVAQVSETTRVSLPLRALFQAPTVAGLAGYLDMVATPTRDEEMLEGVL